MPEKILEHLIRRMRRHLLWDSLLDLLPPAIAILYLAIVLHPSLDVSRSLGLASAAFLGAAFARGIWRFRTSSTVPLRAARLIDQKVEGKERFLTLATIDASTCAASLLSRLRQEALDFLPRFDLRKDFPYRFKRSFFISMIAALSLILVFHLFIERMLLDPAETEIAFSARRFSRESRFEELTRGFQSLAAQSPALSETERRSLVEELLNEVQEKLSAETDPQDKELLRQAASALRGMGKGGEKGDKGQEEGGHLTSNLPEEGKGGGATKRGGGEEGEHQEASARDLERQGPTQGPQRGQGGEERKALEGGLKGDREEKKETGSGAAEGRGGRQKDQGIPQGEAAERFLKPGEQEKGIKVSRFINVQLPEEDTADSTKRAASKNTELRPRVPISNVPLRRADFPAAAQEKQPLPLEYRSVIR